LKNGEHYKDTKGWERKAHERLLEYVKELYTMPIDLYEKAYFIRKLETLTEFVEVLKDDKHCGGH
jgi:hypothetical protein